MSKLKLPYRAFDQFVLRIPLLPFQFYEKLTEGSEVSLETLKKSFDDPLVKEAVFLASPTLYFELKKWVEGEIEAKKTQRVQLSFLKYLSRMSSRCTPFGLFAGCTVGRFAELTKIEIKENALHRRFTRPDMNYLVALSQDFAKRPHIKNQLQYFPNTSMYGNGNKLRYIEYFYVNSARQHHIVEIDDSPYLQKILKRAVHGASMEDLAQLIIDDEISPEEAFSFLNELLDSQVLVSNLEPSVSGDPFVDQMLQILNSLNGCDDEIEFLENISKCFQGFDMQLGNEPEKYLELSSYLKKQTTVFDLKYLFQTDLEPQSVVCELAKEHLEQIKKALVLFNQLTSSSADNNLSRFKESFYNRYDQREMPLSKVLDVETGIGYLQNFGHGDINPLVDDLIIPSTENAHQEVELKLPPFHNRLLEVIGKARSEGVRVIQLDELDLLELPKARWTDLPDTFSTMIAIINEDGKTKIQLSSFGGSSAANLLGRFCHKGSKVTELAENVAYKEKAMNPDKIIAEIVHLPEARVGNILMRPSFHDYEIPYLAKSTLEDEKRLSIDDLFISIRENRIYLRSKTHNKEVIPRLTNAHNFSANGLPIYHFLADLQTQNLRGGVYFSLAPLSTLFDFLPRIEYGDLIVSEAVWHIQKKEFESLIDKKSQKGVLMQELYAFREKKGIPKYVVLVDGDNELLIDFINYTSVLMLIETVKNRNQFVLKEFLQSQEGCVKSKKGHFTNQFIVSFYREESMKPNKP